MKRAEMLDAAKACVCGQREQDYGTPEDNFSRIAELWTAYLGNDVDSKDVANMMILFKMGRAMAGGTDDTYIDIAGYAACACEIMEGYRSSVSE